jgi:hypothetical protein
MANGFPKLVALTGRAVQRKSVQIPGLQHHSDVKSYVVALKGAAAQTGAVNRQAGMQNWSLFPHLGPSGSRTIEKQASRLERRWHGATLAIAASILLVNCSCQSAGQSTGTRVSAITPPAAQSTKATEVRASLSVQLVDPEGKPLERQTLVMMPLSEGYSESVGRGPFFADRDGKVIVDSLAPGRHSFVLNQQALTPTFVEFTVPPEGLTTRAIVLSRETSTTTPDLNVMVALRAKDGARTSSLLDVTISNNTERPYALSATDLVLLGIAYRVFPPEPHKGAEVPPKGKGTLALTLDWDEYCVKGLWCSRRGEDNDWPETAGDKDVAYYRVGVANCYSLEVPLHVPVGVNNRQMK